MALVNLIGIKALRQRIGRLRLRDMSEPTHAALVDAWEQAASAFVSATLQRILVDTGMSAASLFPLARLVRGGDVSEIEQFIAARNKHGQLPGVPTFPRGVRTATGFQQTQTGDRLGERAFRLTVGDHKRPIFIFTFQTVVFQHALHETSAGGGQNRQSLEIGRVAFVNFINENFAQRAEIVLSDVLRGRTIRREVFGIQRRFLFGTGV